METSDLSFFADAKIMIWMKLQVNIQQEKLGINNVSNQERPPKRERRNERSQAVACFFNFIASSCLYSIPTLEKRNRKRCNHFEKMNLPIEKIKGCTKENINAKDTCIQWYNGLVMKMVTGRVPESEFII